MASRIRVTNNAAKGFRRRAQMVQRSLPGLLRRAGRICAVSLATQTQPFGIGTDAQQLGQTAVVRDIRRVYALPSDAFPAFTNKKAAGASGGPCRLAIGPGLTPSCIAIVRNR